MPAASISSRVYWSDDQATLVVRKMLELQAADPNITKRNAAKLAQKATLPPNKQRIITSSLFSPSGRYGALYDKVWKQGVRDATKRVSKEKEIVESAAEPSRTNGAHHIVDPVDFATPSAAVVTSPPSHSTEEAPAEPAPQVARASHEAPDSSMHLEYSAFDGLADAFREAMRDAVRNAILEAVTQLQHAVERAKPSFVNSLPPPALHPVDRSPVPRKPKILVVGLKDKCKQFLTAKLNTRATLYFWNDDNIATLRATGKNFDCIVVNTGHISHAVDWACQEANERVHRVSGSNTNVLRFVTTLLDQSPGVALAVN